jgi:hypothetical protein
MIKSKDYKKTELIRMVVKKLKRKPSECAKLTKNQLCNLLNKKKKFKMSSQTLEQYKKLFEFEKICLSLSKLYIYCHNQSSCCAVRWCCAHLFSFK